MEIYLLRHGMTPWNYENRIQGVTDIELHEYGLKMAIETGEALRKEGITFDLVYSSPLKRAVDSAKAVAGTDDIILDDRIREMCFGYQEGKQIADMVKAGMPFEFFVSDPVKYEQLVDKDPGVESYSTILARAAEFLQDVVEKSLRQDIRILISAHGALNQALMMHMRHDTDISNYWKGGLMDNCSINIIDYDAGTKEYTIKKQSRIYYSDELYKLAPKLLK